MNLLKLALMPWLITGATAATITTLNIGTSSPTGIPCNSSVGSPGPVTCLSYGGFSLPASSYSYAEIVGDATIKTFVDGEFASAAARGTISSDELFSVNPTLSQVFGVFHLACQFVSTVSSASDVEYSIGGSPQMTCRLNPHGGLGVDQMLTVRFPVDPSGHVEVSSFLSASYEGSDLSSGGTATLAFQGFQDAVGNPVAATLVPEPATCGMLSVGLLVLVGRLRRRS